MTSLALLLLLAAPPSLAVKGFPTSEPLTLAALKALGSVKENWTAKGETHVIEGVPLHKVMEKLGFTKGEMRALPAPKKLPGLRKALVVRAGDGFEAVFSTAELLPELGAAKAVLVLSIDGKPVPEAEGPFRLMVLSDQQPERAVRQVSMLELVDLSETAKP